MKSFEFEKSLKILFLTSVFIIGMSILAIANADNGSSDANSLSYGEQRDGITIGKEAFYDKENNEKEFLDELIEQEKNKYELEIDSSEIYKMLIDETSNSVLENGNSIHIGKNIFKSWHDYQCQDNDYSVSAAAYPNDGLGPVVITGKRNLKWPLPGNYGLRSCFYDQRNHLAIDIDAPQGTAIYPSLNGVVEQTFTGGYGDGYGNYVVVRHDNYELLNGTKVTIWTKYNHMSTVDVIKDQPVTQSTRLGGVGKTGYAEGYHLDFQVFYGSWSPLKKEYNSNSLDPYSNQLLELPSALHVTDSDPSGCGNDYFEKIKALYAVSPDRKPVGWVDSVSGGNGMVTVSGWAYDKDDTSQALTMHVYIGGQAGDSNAEVHVITANKLKEGLSQHPDHQNVGDYHGFSETFDTALTGTVPVYIYAINIGANVIPGDNPQIMNSPQNAAITPVNLNTLSASATDYYNGNRYERFDKALTWSAAKAFCESKGGHLVAITSAEENTFVSNLISGGSKNFYALGASSFGTKGNWQWVNDENWTYQNWDTQSIEGNTDGQECAFIIGKENPPNKQVGEWIDNPDDSRSRDFYHQMNSGFICEYEAGKEMVSGYDRVLPDGDYLIVTVGTTDKSTFYYLDIEGTAIPAENLTNVSLCGPSVDPAECEMWTISYKDGFYSIVQKGTNKALDVNDAGGNGAANGRNVQVWENASSSNQLWAISKNGGEGYRLESKRSGFSLDIAGGKIANGTNVRQWLNNNEPAQRWLFIPYKPAQPIDEGKYVLLSALGDEWELDVSGDTGDVGNGINVQIWNDGAASRYNSFRLVKLPNGYYKFVHDASGKCLDVLGGIVTSSGNIGLYDDNGSIAQQWAIRKNGEGYAVLARCSGYAMDVWGNAGDGVNVAQGYLHGGSNQTWKFVQAEYTVSYDANGGSGAPAEQTKYYKSDLTLRSAEPLREGYIFQGWAADDATADRPDYTSGESFTEDKDITLYAVWEPECEHQVTYFVKNEPTHTETGSLTGTCTVCGKEVEIELPVLNETDYQYEVKETSTCQKTGTALYTWSESNSQTFEFEGQIEKIPHDYMPSENPPTCSDSGSVTYTCSMCGESYTEYRPVEEPNEQEGWSTEKPAGVTDDMIFIKIQYRFRDLQTTSSTASSMTGWQQTGSSTSYGNWGAWSAWQTTAVNGSDTREVGTSTVYPYYYFYCTHCGRGARYPYQGSGRTCEICGLSGYITLETGTVDWFTNPWSASVQWGSDTAKHYQYIYDSRVGANAIYWNWTDGSATTGYRYRDRSKTVTYTYQRWGDWSDWSDTKYTSSSTRQVETRVVYKYDEERDNRHVWAKPEYEWDEENSTLTAYYTCEMNALHTKTEVLENLEIIKLPAQLKEIREEAFEGLSCQVVIIPEGCTTIKSRAFADCDELLFVEIPESVSEIAGDAFEGCLDVWIQRN